MSVFGWRRRLVKLSGQLGAPTLLSPGIRRGRRALCVLRLGVPGSSRRREGRSRGINAPGTRPACASGWQSGRCAFAPPFVVRLSVAPPADGGPACAGQSGGEPSHCRPGLFAPGHDLRPTLARERAVPSTLHRPGRADEGRPVAVPGSAVFSAGVVRFVSRLGPGPAPRPWRHAPTGRAATRRTPRARGARSDAEAEHGNADRGL